MIDGKASAQAKHRSRSLWPLDSHNTQVGRETNAAYAFDPRVNRDEASVDSQTPPDKLARALRVVILRDCYKRLSNSRP